MLGNLKICGFENLKMKPEEEYPIYNTMYNLTGDPE